MGRVLLHHLAQPGQAGAAFGAAAQRVLQLGHGVQAAVQGLGDGLFVHAQAGADQGGGRGGQALGGGRLGAQQGVARQGQWLRAVQQRQQAVPGIGGAAQHQGLQPGLLLRMLQHQAAAVLALGIGVQNLPEGLAVALPFRAGGMSRGRSFALGALSGAVEPVFGMLAALAAGMMQGALPGMMAFCAGAMMQVVFAEMAPQAAKSRAGLFALMTGYALMMALDLALG